jgi:hypothetical protein
MNRSAAKAHLEQLAAVIAAGMLSSWHRGSAGRIFDAKIIAEDALSHAREIIKTSDRFLEGWPGFPDG